MDRRVTFWQGIIWSECHVLTRYYGIGVSRSDTITLKKRNLEVTKYTYSQRTCFQNKHGLEAWVPIGVLDVVIDGVPIMVLLSMVHVFVACHLLSIVVGFILLFDIYILFSILSWPMIPTQYVFLVLTPNCIFFFVICGVQQVYHQLQLARSSRQSPTHQSSGWAIISSSCWILSFTSWCLWNSDMDHLFIYFGFLNTLRLGNLRIDVLDVMTSRFWE